MLEVSRYLTYTRPACLCAIKFVKKNIKLEKHFIKKKLIQNKQKYEIKLNTNTKNRNFEILTAHYYKILNVLILNYILIF